MSDQAKQINYDKGTSSILKVLKKKFQKHFLKSDIICHKCDVLSVISLIGLLLAFFF